MWSRIIVAFSVPLCMYMDMFVDEDMQTFLSALLVLAREGDSLSMHWPTHLKGQPTRTAETGNLQFWVGTARFRKSFKLHPFIHVHTLAWDSLVKGIEEWTLLGKHHQKCEHAISNMNGV